MPKNDRKSNYKIFSQKLIYRFELCAENYIMSFYSSLYWPWSLPGIVVWVMESPEIGFTFIGCHRYRSYDRISYYQNLSQNIFISLFYWQLFQLIRKFPTKMDICFELLHFLEFEECTRLKIDILYNTVVEYVFKWNMTWLMI